MLRQLQSQVNEARGTAACADVRGVLDRSESRWVVTPRNHEPASLRPLPWIALAKLTAAHPQELLLAFMWQGSSTSLGFSESLNRY